MARWPRRTSDLEPTAQQSALALAGAAALGLVAGLVAAAGKRGAHSAANALTGDWLDVLKAEQLTLADMFERLDRSKPGQPRRRLALLARIRHALERYAFEEESVVYPVLRRSEPVLAAELTENHAGFKAAVDELEQSDPDENAWLMRARALAERIESHARREEMDVFPPFRAQLSAREDRRLTQRLFKAGRRLA
ncbi:MAG TPA: hemerythrin domain-containing protein [Caulobacteraceae bacterium]